MPLADRTTFAQGLHRPNRRRRPYGLRLGPAAMHAPALWPNASLLACAGAVALAGPMACAGRKAGADRMA